MANDTEKLHDGDSDGNDGANQSRGNIDGNDDANQPGEENTKPKEEHSGMDFVREAEDEQSIQAEYVRRTLNEVDARREKEEIGKGAKAIYEAVNGTPEDDEIRRKIIENSKNRGGL